MENYWVLSGEIVKIRDHVSYDIGATVTVRCSSKRKDCDTSSIVEVQLVIPELMWRELTRKGLKPYSLARFEGHFETWCNDTDNNLKIKLKHVVDEAEVLKV